MEYFENLREVKTDSQEIFDGAIVHLFKDTVTLPNGDVIINIDGEHFTTISKLSTWVGSVGDCSFVMNMIRNPQQPTSEADNMEVTISNLAFGKYYTQENILDRLTEEDLLGENQDAFAVTTNLTLPTVITNGQLDTTYEVTWSSDNAAITADGVVTRPVSGGVLVNLTATLANGDTKTFQFIVVGEEVGNDGTLIVTSDTAPGSKGGTSSNAILFTLDQNNNSIIRDLGEKKTINLVTLTDIDAVQQNGAFAYIIETHEQIDDRGFSCACRTDDGNGFAGKSFQPGCLPDGLDGTGSHRAVNSEYVAGFAAGRTGQLATYRIGTYIRSGDRPRSGKNQSS